MSLLVMEGVSRRFGERWALRNVSLEVHAGEIHALLGPNGAGKTTLLRILAGLVRPDSGRVVVAGRDAQSHALRRSIGVVPSGDRSFYLRISGLENLVFFARLHGFSRRAALRRGAELIGRVGLDEAARVPVGVYSHGMQKRLSVARALLAEPVLLLVDEATHDLDPEGARRIRRLIEDAAGEGSAVVWTTQRVDEIRGFVKNVTLLNRGEVRFVGSVPQFMSYSRPQRFHLRLRHDRLLASGDPDEPRLESVLGEVVQGKGTLRRAQDDSEHYLLALDDGVVLGDVLALFTSLGVSILTCAEEKSEIEEAFFALTDEPPA
jgi:ABC-type multidrug transport system ATPase subunit